MPRPAGLQKKRAGWNSGLLDVRYRVAFAARVKGDLEETTIDPSTQLDPLVADGVVAEKLFVERLEPEAKHNQPELDADDDFLASATPEVWEYEVVDDRAGEFEDAIQRCEDVLEYEVIEQSTTSSEELPDPSDEVV
jgi:hypothetical protein